MTNRQWAMVRVRGSTHSRLEKFRDSLLASYQQGRIALPDSQAEGISFDFVINNLIDRVLSHRERARKQRKRKSVTGQDPTEASVGDPTQAMYTSSKPENAARADACVASLMGAIGFSSST